jgi:hypothetical protein
MESKKEGFKVVCRFGEPIPTRKDSEKVVVQQVQDTTDILRVNELTRIANGSGTSSFWKNRHYVKIASIPMVLLDLLMPPLQRHRPACHWTRLAFVWQLILRTSVSRLYAFFQDFTVHIHARLLRSYRT